MPSNDFDYNKLPPIQLTSYKGASLLNGTNLKTYNLGDEKLRINLNGNRQKFYNEVKKIKASDQPIIHYDIHQFPSDFTLQKTLRIRRTVNDAEKKGLDNSKLWRNLTKDRSVTSTVQCIANGYGISCQPFNITLTTGCAPNFMNDKEGDIPIYTDAQLNYLVADTTRIPKIKTKGNPPVEFEVEIYKFTDDGKHFYKEQMKLQFKRWLWIQNQQGVNVVIFPMVGGGVYLQQLIQTSQNEARVIIHNALKEAIQEFNEEYKVTNIQEVIYTLPDDNNNSADYMTACYFSRDYGSTSTTKPPVFTIANGDVFEVAEAIANDPRYKGIKVGMINPGSDRTIGGAYKSQYTLDPQNKDKIPLEETIFHLTNATTQTIDSNKNNFAVYKKESFPSGLQSINPFGKKPNAPLPTPQASASDINVNNNNNTASISQPNTHKQDFGNIFHPNAPSPEPLVPPLPVHSNPSITTSAPVQPAAPTNPGTPPAPQAQPVTNPATQPQPAANNPAPTPAANAASIQAPANINLTDTWMIRERLKPRPEWKALNLKKVSNSEIKGQSSKGTEITITKNSINFSFKNLNAEKDTIRQALKLLITAANGANYETKSDAEIHRLNISFSGDDKVQQVLKSVCQEPDFAKYFNIIEPMLIPDAAENNDNDDAHASIPGLNPPGNS